MVSAIVNQELEMDYDASYRELHTSSLLLLGLGCCRLASRQRTKRIAQRQAIKLKLTLPILVAACSMLTFISSAQAVPVAPSLIAYFPLDESPGSSTAANSVGGGNTGALVNFPDLNAAWVSDTPPALSHSTGSLLFPGYDGSNIIRTNISGSAPTEYINSAQPFTLSTWFRLTNGALPDPNPSSLFPFISTLSNDTAESWGVFLGSSAPSAYEGINFGSPNQWGRITTTDVTVTELEDADWHHLLITFDGVDEDAVSSFVLYFDGLQRTIAAQGGGFAGNVNDYIGAGDAARFNMDGNIDDFALFSEVLSAEQIAFLAEGGSPLFPPPVPEPSSFLLIGLGALGMLRHARRRRRTNC